MITPLPLRVRAFIDRDHLDGFASHRVPMAAALALTGDFGVAAPVLELGMGDGSTPYIHRWAIDEGLNRRVVSMDSDKKWADRFLPLACETRSVVHCESWAANPIESAFWGAVLIDHAPGERRRVDLARCAQHATFVVVHDTEQGGAGDYRYDEAWPLYKYRRDFTDYPAWATVVSNFVDVTQWNWDLLATTGRPQPLRGGHGARGDPATAPDCRS